MNIVSTAIEPGHGSTACIDFLIRVTLDGPAEGGEVNGRVVGPRAPSITTVEVVYPLMPVEVSGNLVSLKGVIPEPSFWSREAPFSYTWSVEVRVNGEQVDSRSGSVAFPATPANRL